MQTPEQLYLEESRRNPPQAAARYARTLASCGRVDDAVAVLRSVESDDPAEMVTLAGVILGEAGRGREAVAVFREVVRRWPNWETGYMRLGNALWDLNELDEFVGVCRAALLIRPDAVNVWVNIGVALTRLRQDDSAAAALRRAIDMDPSHAAAHLNLSLLWLSRGNFLPGWAEYEWRWRAAGRAKPAGATEWDGSALSGRTILLYAEQGIGDTIQMVRYLPAVIARGGRVVLQVAPTLVPLLAGIAGVAGVYSDKHASPAADLRLPLLGLPCLMKTDAASIPPVVPVVVPPVKSAVWRRRVGGVSSRRVGFAWSGNPTHTGDRYRSVAVDMFLPISRLPGVTPFSLQVGPAGFAARPFLLRERWVDLTPHVTDWADTAALIEQLDLVVTVDTAVAHLAATMGKPTWVLLPKWPDWRWQLDRPDSPWYPTARLFRQTEVGQWAPVVEAVREALVRSPA